MISLPPTEFTYGKYNAGIIPFIVFVKNKLLIKWLLEQNIIGYCNSEECEIRPMKDNIAVMIEVDNWEGWQHIPLETWNHFLDILNRR